MENTPETSTPEQGVPQPQTEAQSEPEHAGGTQAAFPGETGGSAPFIDVSALPEEQIMQLYERAGASKGLIKRMGEIARERREAMEKLKAMEAELAELRQKASAQSTEEEEGLPQELASFLRYDETSQEYVLPTGETLAPSVVELLKATVKAARRPLQEHLRQEEEERKQESMRRAFTDIAQWTRRAAEDAWKRIDPNLSQDRMSLLVQDAERDMRDTVLEAIAQGLDPAHLTEDLVRQAAEQSVLARAKAYGYDVRAQRGANIKAAVSAPIRADGSVVASPTKRWNEMTEDEQLQAMMEAYNRSIAEQASK